MVTKRVSPGKKPTRRKAAAEVPVLTDSVALPGLESKRSPAAIPKSVDPNVRRQLVAAEAYFLAERRGFRAGGELEDWVAAEATVDSRLRQMQAA
jgi:Protein of unknown function (DUF2934)